MLARLYILLCVALIFVTGKVNAQLVAHFTTNNVVGCVPFVTTFNDASSGGNITYRHWDFGNGNQSSQNLSVASASYVQAGSFVVTLTVSDGFDTASISQTIEVHSNPTARIALQNNFIGCAPFTFNTLDSSLAANSSIVNYEWSFDDGTPNSFGSNISHIYNYAGNFDLSLIVTDSVGCSGSTVIPNAITVIAPPSVSFQDTTTSIFCSPPFPVSLVNTSIGTGNLTSQWLLANQTYNTTNLNTQLHQFGDYEVSLLVTDQFGCKDSISLPSAIVFDSASFQLYHPDTICKKTPFTITTISNFNDSTWMSFDGVLKPGANITNSFNYSGIHDIWVFGKNTNGCIDSLHTEIVVDSVNSNFGVSSSFSCQVPFSVQYSDSSLGAIAEYEYRLGFGGKGSQKTIANPLVNIPVPGTFSDSLIVTSQFGCKDTAVLSNHLTIHVTEAAIQPSVLSGCAPLTVNFINASSPIDSVASVSWDYDDNSPVVFSFTQLNGSHTFTNAGEYRVKLLINTFSGCQDSAFVTIRVGTPQTAHFDLTDTVICASSAVGFSNLSSDTSLINEYLWDFGDGTNGVNSNPNHLFQDTGWLNLRLIAGYNGCYDTLEVDSGIYVKGPILDYSSQVNCLDPNEITFLPNVKGGHIYQWDFGDGLTLNQSHQTTHTYNPLDSIYEVSFYAEDTITGCHYSYEDSVRVIFLQAHLTTPNLAVCKGDFIDFYAVNSLNANQFEWQINGTGWSPGTAIKSYGLGTMGNNFIEVIAEDANGCLDTASIVVSAHKPLVKFGIQQLSGCDSVSAQFIDSTISEAGVQSYLWNFGNGNMSNSYNPIEAFTGNSGATFTISYTVTDTLGCTDSYSIHKGVVLNYPTPFFDITDTVLCIGDSLDINHNSKPGIQYAWDFGDGTISNAIFPSKVYVQSGFFPVSLTHTNISGCDSTYGPIMVSVNDLPMVDFDVVDSVNVCFPVDVKFQSKYTDSSHIKWTWNFGDSPQNAVLQFDSAFNQYNTIGNYDVSLKVENMYGCIDSLFKKQAVKVSGPYGVLAVAPEGCLNINTPVTFSADSLTSLTDNLFWDFGDGIVQNTTSSQTSVIHNYNLQGVFVANLISSNAQQSCFFVSKDTISITNYQAEILASSPKGCVPFELGAISGAINETNYDWIYNGNSIGSQEDVNIIVENYGLHRLQLVVWNDSVNCPDTASIEIWGNEPLDLVLPEDVSVCEGKSVSFSLDTGYSYRWGPLNAVSNPHENSITVSPKKNQWYFVDVSDTNGCELKDSVLVKVNQAIQIHQFQSDTSLLADDVMLIRADIDNYESLIWEGGYTSLSCYDCMNPQLSYPEPSEVHLNILPLPGCTPIDTSFNVFTDETFKIFLPNAFTPSGDGLNDVFKVQGTGIEALEYFYIYDRWGGVIFETNDVDQGWDGTVNSEPALANQMYTYKVKAIGPNNMVKTLVGAVTLVSR